MDAIMGALEGACNLTGALCDAAGLSDFDLAMDNQAALIESQGIATRATIDAQTSIMQSEAAHTRLNQILYNPYGYQSRGKSGKIATILGVLISIACAIGLVALTIILTR